MKKLLTVVLLVLWTTLAFGQVPHVSIQDIQRVSLDSLLLADTIQTGTRYTLQASSYMNDTVEVTGICVVPKGVFGYNSAGWSILLYDTANVSQWRGLWLRVNSLSDTAQAILDGFDGVEPGDIITVRGVVGEFPTNAVNSLTQLNYLPGHQIVPIGKTAVPPPTQLDVATFYKGLYPGGTIQFSAGEPYESMVVEFTNLQVPSYLNTANGTFNMVQNGNMISSYDASDYYTLRRANPPGWTYQMPPLNGVVDTIRGVIWVVSGGENPRGYRVSPVFPGDLVVGTAYPLVDSVSRSPWVVAPDSSVRVIARVRKQESGFPIDTVNLYYSINKAKFNVVQMTRYDSVNSMYQATIPGLPDTNFVRYYVKAFDNQKNGTTVANLASSGGGDTTKGFMNYTVLSRPMTIKDVQYTPYSNGYSAYAGTYPDGATVTVSGVITADTTDILYNQRSLVGGTYGWYMQTGNAPWNGIWLVGDSTMTVLRRGDSVTVTGTVQEWISFSQGVTTRIANIHAPVIHSHGNPIPDPVSLKTGTFGPNVASGNKNAEPYEGMLVKFTKAWVSDIYPYYADPSQYEINDGTGGIWVHRDGTNTYTNVPADSTGPEWHVLRVGDTLSTITGIIHFSVNRYKFVPRSNADFGSITSGVELLPSGIPAAYKLEQNYPNPFNPSTTIEYSIPTNSPVTLKIFNLLGQEVRTLVNSVQAPGHYMVRFDAHALSSGLYFYRLQAGSFHQVNKMLLVK